MWMYETAAAKNEQGVLIDEKGIWNNAQKRRARSLALSYFPKRRTEMLKEGYKIPGEFSDTMRALPRVRYALKKRDSFETKSLKQLEAFILEPCTGEEVLKKQSARVLWNPIFNADIEFIEKIDWDGVVARYTSMN